MDASADAEITRLEDLGLRELREHWLYRFGENPPACKSTGIVRRLLASRLQEQAFGGLPPETRQKLKKLAQAFERNPDHALTPRHDLKPGTVLTREWQGTLHQVRVLENGFEYGGDRFASLSEVARKITGTRWSGPLFFGLKK